MKKTLFLAIAAMILALAASSCGGGGNSKSLTCEDKEFSGGTVADCIEIADNTAELTFSTVKGGIDKQVFTLKVKLEKTHKGFEGLSPRDIEIGGFYPATVKLLDDNGAEIQQLSIGDQVDKLKKLLVAPVGTADTITFTADFHNSEAAPEWFKQISKFKGGEVGSVGDLRQAATQAQSVVSASEPKEGQASAPTNTGNFNLAGISLPSVLKGKVEIVEASKYVENNFPYMSITFKLLKPINTSSLTSPYGQMWIVGAGQNANGTNIKAFMPNYGEWRSQDSDGREFKNFLEGEPGETINLVFSGDKCDEAATELEKVVKFKLWLTKP